MRLIFRIVLTLLSCMAFAAQAELSSIAFYYADPLPVEKLRAYNVAVVDADAGHPKEYNTPTSELFAYVSVGEMEPEEIKRRRLPADWFVGENKIWEAKVVDQTRPEWQKYFIKNIITPMWEKGYRGFFLDTLDSYQLAYKDNKSRQKQVDALKYLIHQIKVNYPDAKIIFNRGFELLPQLQKDVYALAAESLFGTWNQDTKTYGDVPKEEREELLKELKQVQNMGVPVIVIDYAAPTQAKKRKEIAQKIRALGMIPWVADGYLQTLPNNPLTALSTIPRKIAVIYTMKKTSTNFDPSAFLLIGLPLQFMGYQAIFYDANQNLPLNLSKKDYAGIVVWAEPSNAGRQQALQIWVNKNMHTLPIAFIGSFGFKANAANLNPLGLKVSTASNSVPKNLHVSIQNKEFIGFEIQPYPNRLDFLGVRAPHDKVLLQLTSNKHQVEDAVVLTSWGGYALDPYVVSTLPNERSLWILHPFKWLKQALRLKTFPVPDMTTENGLRLLFAHIDGDGFTTITESAKSTEDISAVEFEKEILKKYPIPASVSVITGEIAPNGLYPEQSPLYQNVARRIFASPLVEVASHTYSHPFDWVLAAKDPTSKKYRLPIPNYKFNLTQEIKGSIDYINQNLVPANKKAKMIFWSGDANLDMEALKITKEANIGNLNGGDTNITQAFPYLAAIGPYGLAFGNYFQVYAAISNEEFYTNGWTGPFYGYQRVIQTFQLTDKPYRLKPIDIYYHFYSLSKNASTQALQKVYDWALQQPVMPIFASEYGDKVVDARNASIALKEDGWVIQTKGAARELRLPIELGFPDLSRSENVIGYNDYQSHRYIHLGPATITTLYLKPTKNSLPYLVSANGRITRFKRKDKGFDFAIQSHVPVQIALAQDDHCHLIEGRRELSAQKNNGISSYKLRSIGSNELSLQCQ